MTKSRHIRIANTKPLASRRTRERTTPPLTAVFLAAFVATSCSKSQAQPEHAVPAVKEPATVVPTKVDTLDVPADGKQFKPPVHPEQIPAGAWYCDMGLVHWAQLKEGNHQCPLCKMELKQKK